MAKIEPVLTFEQQLKKNLDRAKYGWSRYGGPNRGLVQEDLTEEWNCQACGETQTNQLPPYMYEFSPREFVRICSKCHYTRLQEAIEPLQFDILIAIVRVHHDNLDNLPQ